MQTDGENQKENEHFEELFQKAPFAIFEIDYTVPRFKRVNEMACLLSGYSEQEFFALNPFAILDAESLKRFMERIKQGLAGQKIDENVEFKLKAKDGHDVWAMLKVEPTYNNGKLQSALVVGFDITERRKTEEALKQAEAHYHTLFDNIEDGFQLVEVIRNEKGETCDFRYLEVNSAYEKQTGMKSSQVLGKLTSEIIPNFGRYWLDVFGNVEKTGAPALFANLGRPDGRFYQTYAFKFANNQVGVLFKDVSESKKVQEALRYSSRQFSLLSSITSQLLSSAKPQETIQQICERVMGFLNCDVFFNFLVDEKEQKLHLNAYYGVSVETARTLEWLSFGEAVCGCAAQEGHRIVCENIPYTQDHRTELVKSFGVKAYCANPIFSDGKVIGTLSFGTKKKPFFTNEELTLMKTVTAQVSVAMNRKKAEEKLEEYSKNLERMVEERTKQLKDAERLAAIGATAGMVGHDIRNPLQAIVGDVYLLKDYLETMPKVPVKPDIVESLEAIEKNIGYINKIVADLQDYARPLRPDYQEVNLYDLVSRVFDPITIPNNVNPEINIDLNIRLKTDATLFMRILSNLVINAIQAMPNGGNLVVDALTSENKMSISVKDTGVGIPEDVKPKLFTPMMTTKAKGQGLGLAVVKRLVEALKGNISFESEEEKGTKFTIQLPLNP